MFSQDDIVRELRALARDQAREQLPMEARLLCAGHLDQEDVPAALPDGVSCPRLSFHRRAVLPRLRRARSIN